jgi:hypothetical protein
MSEEGVAYCASSMRNGVKMFLRVQNNQLPKCEEYTKKQTLTLKNGQKVVKGATSGKGTTSEQGATSGECAAVAIVEAVDV